MFPFAVANFVQRYLGEFGRQHFTFYMHQSLYASIIIQLKLPGYLEAIVKKVYLHNVNPYFIQPLNSKKWRH
jgi:hypothetical protein